MGPGKLYGNQVSRSWCRWSSSPHTEPNCPRPVAGAGLSVQAGEASDAAHLTELTPSFRSGHHLDNLVFSSLLPLVVGFACFVYLCVKCLKAYTSVCISDIPLSYPVKRTTVLLSTIQPLIISP